MKRKQDTLMQFLQFYFLLLKIFVHILSLNCSMVCAVNHVDHLPPLIRNAHHPSPRIAPIPAIYVTVDIVDLYHRFYLFINFGTRGEHFSSNILDILPNVISSDSEGDNTNEVTLPFLRLIDFSRLIKYPEAMKNCNFNI